MFKNLLDSVLHNIGVLIVGFIWAFVGTQIDFLLGVQKFQSSYIVNLGITFLVTGFVLRVWATFHFYQLKMKVISLVPQKDLITTGPYVFSRNPLYLGGNIFIFFGASLVLLSPSAFVITLLHLPLIDLMVRREEKGLEKNFGIKWFEYQKKVRRWF